MPGDGYSFSVPASADLQELTVWVSAHHATGRLTATLGGITQTDLTVAGGQNHGGVYRIQFNGSGAIGETLTVSWTLNSAVNPSVIDESGFASTEANVVIYAAAVRSLVTPAAAPILVRAATGLKRRHPRTAPGRPRPGCAGRDLLRGQLVQPGQRDSGKPDQHGPREP